MTSEMTVPQPPGDELLLPTASSRPLDAALAYVALGLQVVQLCVPNGRGGCTCPPETCAKPGKRPRRKGWQNMGTTQDEVRAWWRGTNWVNSNVGLVMGGTRRLVALDIDGDLGRTSLAALEREHGQLPRTLTQRTGSGGEHQVFVCPDDLDLDAIDNTAGAVAVGLDVRATAGQIVVAPSLHVNGNRYEWINQVSPAVLPRWLYDLIVGRETRRAREEGRNSRQRVIPWNDAVERGVLADVRNAPAGKRNDALNSGALRLFRVGLTAARNLDELHARLREAARKAGLSDGEIEPTLRSARAAAQQQGPAEMPDRDNTQTRRAPETNPRPLVEVIDTGRAMPRSSGADELSVVMVGPDIHRVADQALVALAQRPSVYQRAGVGLAHIVRAPELPASMSDHARDLRPPPMAPIIEAIPVATVAEWLSACVDFRAPDGRTRDADGNPRLRRVQPPGAVVAALAARRGEGLTGVRPLMGVIEAPALRPDGSIITSPGYDHATGLFLVWQGAPLDVPDAPSRIDAERAYSSLALLFADYRFQGDESARKVYVASTIAAILTPLARSFVNGPVPAFMWEADAPNAGKTLAATVCGTIATGRAPAARQYTDDDDETAKRLAAIAVAGCPVMLLDNVRGHVEGGALEGVLTARETIAARILGSTTDRELPWRTTVYATANQVTYSRDVSRRVIHIMLRGRGAVVGGLTPGTSQQQYAIEDLVTYAREHRRDLLTAALTILRAHIVAGRPRRALTLDTFESWSRVVADAIAWCSDADPVRARPPEHTDRDTDIARRVCLAWHAAFPKETLTLTAARDRCLAASSSRPGADVEALLDLRTALADLVGVGDLARASNVGLGKRFLAAVAEKEFQVRGGEFVVVASRGQNRNGVALYESRTRAGMDRDAGQ